MDFKFHTLNNNADPTFNQLLAINDSGVIAGYFGSGVLPDHPNKGYTLAPPFGQANYTNENFPTSVQTQVTGINNFNVTVGFWADAAGDNLGFVDRNGSFTTALDPRAPPLGGATPTTEQFLGVNDFGQVAGFYNGPNGNSHGFIYSIATGNFRPVNVPGASSVTATDINDRGQISGFFTAGGVTDGFVKSNGHTTVLTGPKGATDVQALGLNNVGQVVGSFVDAQGNTDGFLYNMATKSYTTIVDPNSNGMTVVNGINDCSDLVGFYLDAAGNTDGMLVTPQNTMGGTMSFLSGDAIADIRAALPGLSGVLAGIQSSGATIPQIEAAAHHLGGDTIADIRAALPSLSDILAAVHSSGVTIPQIEAAAHHLVDHIAAAEPSLGGAAFSQAAESGAAALDANVVTHG